ncbi:MAG TPA: D-2-hydroxyacid dehydrogenase [Chloroflexi bacterium]|nr:D-2-hydroxyacid dehydrogenase [Chloroflexota bacterium]
MPPEVLILSARAADYARLLAAMPLPPLALHAAATSDEAEPWLASCEVVLADPPLVRPLLDRMAALRWLQSTYAGVETLTAPGLRRDYLLTNARGVFGELMAEYVLGYVIMHERRGWQRFLAQRAGRWDATWPGRLRGKTLGLVGVGSIGAEIARTAKCFRLRVLGYTRASEDCPHVDRYFHGDALVDMAAACDYLVASLPNTPASRHLIDRAVLAALPAHALLVNVGRGSTVDEEALVEALQTGRIAGAVLDVFQTEPLPADHPLWKLPNVLITSHTSALSYPEDIAPLFAENLQRYISGQELHYHVDFARGY